VAISVGTNRRILLSLSNPIEKVESVSQGFYVCRDIVEDYIDCVLLRLTPEDLTNRLSYRSLRKRLFFGGSRYVGQTRQNILIFVFRSLGLSRREKISLLCLTIAEIIVREISQGKGACTASKLRRRVLRRTPGQFRNAIKREYTQTSRLASLCLDREEEHSEPDASFLVSSLHESLDKRDLALLRTQMIGVKLEELDRLLATNKRDIKEWRSRFHKLKQSFSP
jgi:hypothetical protein